MGEKLKHLSKVNFSPMQMIPRRILSKMVCTQNHIYYYRCLTNVEICIAHDLMIKQVRLHEKGREGGREGEKMTKPRKKHNLKLKPTLINEFLTL
jgi:hypothetical protein